MADALIDTATRVETPEHIAFEFRLAGPWRRGLAYLLDLLLRIGVMTALVFLTTLVFASLAGLGDDLAALPAGAFLLLYFVAEWFYYVLFEWLWNGVTPGKKALGLRVVKEGGYPIGPGDALLRNLLRAADLLPPLGPFGLGVPTYVVGALVSLADPKYRRLGDLVAGTIVIVEEPARLMAPANIEPPVQPGELDQLPVHLRMKVEERKTLEAFVRRFPAIHPARREELSEAWATQLAARYGAPKPRSSARFLQLVYARLVESSGDPRRLRRGR